MKRSTLELTFCCFFMTLFALLPPLVIDLYPFSTYPMFSQAPTSLYRYTVADPLGQPLNPWQFSLHPLYIANPNPKIGIRFSTTLNPVATPADRDAVTIEAKRVLDEELPYMEYVTITPNELHSDNAGRSVVSSEHPSWKICSPRFPRCSAAQPAEGSITGEIGE